MRTPTLVPALQGNRLTGIAVYRLVIHKPLPDARLLVVAAHPDDETLGAGMLLGRYRNLAIVHVTDGAPRNMEDAHRYGFDTPEAYAQQRRRELTAALAVLGASHAELVALGVPDQQTTANARSIIQQLRAVIARFGPSIVLTHPYEGGHPDHDATAFATRAAVGDVPLWEFSSYHSDGGRLLAGRFLQTEPEPVIIHFTPAQEALKRRAVACFTTQSAMLAQFPTTHENFRPAPAYDFTQPPHPGVLLYEHFNWGMTGERFRGLIRGVD